MAAKSVRTLCTLTVEGFDYEVTQEINEFLAKFRGLNPKVVSIALAHGPGQRIAKTIVVEIDYIEGNENSMKY